MSKAKKTEVSEQELSELFAAVQKNNDKVEQAMKAPPVSEEKPVEVKKTVDKTEKEEYNSNKAFGIHRNKKTQRWEILEIDYNVEDGTARIVDILMSVDNVHVARRRTEEAYSRVLGKLTLEPMRKRKDK